MIAYRVIQDAISVAAFGLGEPISMAEVTAAPNGGKARKLSADELRVLQDKVDEWRAVEGEAITEYVYGPPAAPAGDSDATDEVAPGNAALLGPAPSETT
jgi:hypothetical protein